MPTQLELVKELSVEHTIWHEKYPWFALGQLANAFINQDDPIIIQSAAIFFNDVQRLHWLLHEPAFNKNKILSELNVPISTEGMQSTPQPFPKREHPQEIVQPNILIAIAAVEEDDAIQHVFSTNNKTILVDDVVIHQEEKNSAPTIIDEPTEDQLTFQPIENVIQPNVFVQQPQVVEIEQTETTEEKGGDNTEAKPDENLPTENKTDVDGELELENVQPSATADSTENTIKAQENIKAALDNSEGELQLTFEPYHTIDYFASQGIKVDTKIDDKLGKQLKSFTSWLKSMKRLPATGDVVNDAPAVLINDKSLENSNIVTEAMAAVLIKQGKKEQAGEIFKQLSLLHPEKSRYFAAQIEQIKN